jgi:hypothetical protein
MHEPWSFEDGPEAAARIQREYGRALAVNLPRLPPGTQRTPALTDGYRLLTRAALQASRDYQATRIAGRSRDTADLGRRAQALHAALEVLHRHLVALEQSELLHGFLARTPEAAALEAERNIEALAERVELGTAKGR